MKNLGVVSLPLPELHVPKYAVYDRSVENATAFILAGGKSSRMGADKAFLELEGRTLLDRALELAGTVTKQVKVVGDKTRFAPYGIVVEDIYAERGPLGGIHAALMSSATDFNLMLAVDLPFIGSEFLAYLLSEALHSDAVVTVARTGGGFQPLCAVYRKEFA